MRFTFNWKFFLLSVGLLLAVLAGLHFLHRWQVGQQTGVFLREADAAKAANDPAREMGYLRRYLMAQPGDIEQRERLVRLTATTATTKNEHMAAFLALEGVLQRDPNRTSLRRFTFEFAIKLGYAQEAKTQLTELLRTTPDDAELEERMAYLLAYERNYTAAAEWYQKAYTHKPDMLVAYAGHAAMLRLKLNKVDAADQVFEAMVKANAGDFHAHLYRAKYGRDYNKPDWATTGLAEARKLAPDELDVILAVVTDARFAARSATTKAEAEADRAEARAEIDRGLTLHAKSVPLLLARAELEADVGGPTAGAKSLTAAIAVVPEEKALLFPLADYQIEDADADAATVTLDQLQKLNASPPAVDYERARVLMLRERWAEAVKGLLAVRRAVVTDQTLARKASLMLGRCYEQLGEPDRQLEAFTQAVPDDVSEAQWALAIGGQASAHAALGRRGEALAAALKVADRLKTGWATVARLRLIETLDRPADRRDWSEAERAVKFANLQQPDTTDAKLLTADLLLFQEKADEAKAIVEKLFAERPKEPAVWVAKAATEARAGSRADAVRLLRRGRTELDDPFELRLAEASYVADPEDPDAGKKLLALADGADRYPPVVRRRLLRGLAEASATAGAGKTAGSLWDAVVGVQPDDLSAHLRRFDWALLAGDEDGMVKVEEEIRRIDGTAGTSARMAKALRLLWRAQKKSDPSGLDEALALFDALERDRARWQRVPLGKALVLDLQGKPDAALPYYERAVAAGEKSPDALRRLMALLAAKGRFAEANAVLTDLPDAAISSPEARRLAAEVSLRADSSPRRALELAARAVPADSKNPADLMWLGRLLYAGKDRDGAEKAFRRAVAAKPDDPDGWMLVIDLLLAGNRRDDARKEYEAGRKAVRADAVGLFAARGLATLGQPDEAKEAFAKLRKERPDDLAVLQSEAQFLTGVGQLEAARAAWGRVIDLGSASAEEKQFARQMLGLCFAVDADYTVAKRAVEVLGLDPSGLKEGVAPATPAERRSQAMAMAARRDRAGVLAAIRLLEAADRLEPNDQFLLATLYQRVSDDKGVRKAMSGLLSVADPNPLYLAVYARWLIDRDSPKEAEPLVARLEKAQPDAVVTGELRVRLAAALNDRTAAGAAFKKMAERPNPAALQLGVIAEQSGLLAEAEGQYRAVAEAGKKDRPTAVFPLVGFLARHGRLGEALPLLEAAWKAAPPTAVGQACVEALTAAVSPAKEDVTKVVRWLEAAHAKAAAGDSPALTMALAYARNLQGDFDAAAMLYEGLVSGGRTDPLALNNLAYLRSARQGKHDDALALIEKAKAVAGPLPDLLDTEALIRLNRGREGDAKTARDLLLDVTAMAPSGAAYFHLAMAEEKLKNSLDSKAALAEARRRKLTAADLHPLERGEFGRLFP